MEWLAIWGAESRPEWRAARGAEWGREWRAEWAEEWRAGEAECIIESGAGCTLYM